MPARKHRVHLCEEERGYLAELLSKGASLARKQTRARILLKTDEAEGAPAWSDLRTAEALEVCRATVSKVRKRYAKRSGIEDAISRKTPEREYERKMDGEREAHLIRLACSEAPEGRSRWTLRLLAGRMVELGYVETLSHEAVRTTLKKQPQAASSQAMGNSVGVGCALRLEDERRSKRLPAALRPKVPDGMYG
jgi:hypothetical protein